MNKELKKEIEKGFLEIRGWKNWEEYDNIQESSKIDINIRNELIDTCIQKTKELFKKKIEDLKFKGRFKGIDKETDMAYRKGNNDVLKELLKELEDSPQQNKMKTPYLEIEDLRDDRLGKLKMYSYEEVRKIIKEWDTQAKNQLIIQQNEFDEIVSKLNKRIKELKKEISQQIHKTN